VAEIAVFLDKVGHSVESWVEEVRECADRHAQETVDLSYFLIGIASGQQHESWGFQGR